MMFNAVALGSAAAVVTGATYNAFIQQIGFCRMQSFDTVSRETSNSVPMFMDGRVTVGVGLSDINFQAMQGDTGAFACGMCIEVTKAENSIYHTPFIAMVFDQCTDPICEINFLDFDVYTPTLPVSGGNPSAIEWTTVPCPVHEEETWEYLLCLRDTCHENDAEGRTLQDLLREPVYYWSLTLRNTRWPIQQVAVLDENHDIHTLRLENAWVWDFGRFDLSNGIHLYVLSWDNIGGDVFEEFVNVTAHGMVAPGYRGGILVSSIHQN